MAPGTRSDVMAPTGTTDVGYTEGAELGTGAAGYREGYTEVPVVQQVRGSG